MHIKAPEANPYTGRPTRIMPRARWVWQQHHGPIAKGCTIVQREGNKENYAIGNLAVLTRGELLTLNNPRLVRKSGHGKLAAFRIALAKLIQRTHTDPRAAGETP